MSQQLRVPQGTESFFLEEAVKHKDILRRIEDQYTLWGYLPVQTPMIDFFDSYSELLDKKRIEESYRLINREGELLLLRSDITLFLARQMALTLDKKQLPLRVFYSDSILRYQNHEDISHNEFYQTGCELIGQDSLSGDLEVMMLLHDQLTDLELPPFRIHLGSRALFRALLSLNGLEGQEKEIAALLDTRCYPTLTEFLPAPAVDLLFFIGTFKEFRERCSQLGKEMESALAPILEDFNHSMEQLEEMGVADNFRIDLSEIGGQPYYTGFVFQAYMEGADRAIASGGRYDNLFGKFGMQVSSAGFSILLRKVEKLMKNPPVSSPMTIKKEGNFAQAYKKASSERNKGNKVILG